MNFQNAWEFCCIYLLFEIPIRLHPLTSPGARTHNRFIDYLLTGLAYSTMFRILIPESRILNINIYMYLHNSIGIGIYRV